MIAFRKFDNSCYADGSVVLVFNAKNKLCYFSEDPKTERRIPIIEEPYEEAYKIVEKNSNLKNTHSTETKL
jgi:hypothetical protein